MVIGQVTHLNIIQQSVGFITPLEFTLMIFSALYNNNNNNTHLTASFPGQPG